MLGEEMQAYIELKCVTLLLLLWSLELGVMGYPIYSRRKWDVMSNLGTLASRNLANDLKTLRESLPLLEMRYPLEDCNVSR